MTTKTSATALGTALMASMLVAGTLAACGGDDETAQDDPPSFEASHEFLEAVADRFAGQTWRFEERLAVDNLADPSQVEPAGWGEHNRQGTAATLDPTQVTAALNDLIAAQGGTLNAGNPLAAPELADTDVTIDSVVMGTERYVRMPSLLLELSDEAAALNIDAGWGPLLTLEEGQWAFIDLEQIPGGPAGARVQTPMAGGFTFQPQDLGTLVAHADNIEDLGRRELRGTSVRGLSADLDGADVDAAFGGDRQALDGATAPVPSELWVDDQGLVRQLTVPLGLGGSPDGVDLVMTLDVFDYGDSSIEVTPPADAVDLTDELAPALTAGG